MKYIVVGDTHIGIKNSSKKYMDVVIDLFTQIVNYSKKNNINHLIQVGDLFDNRKSLTHSSIECALKIADMVTDNFEESYFIVGNHDTANKDSLMPHSLMIFNEHTNLHVVDHPMSVGGILLLPWLFSAGDMVDADICCGHFDINGAMMNSSGTLSRNHRLNFSDFSKYGLTLSGHYHTPALYNHNVRYVGSPYQLTFNDMDSLRGFYVLDTETQETEFIIFDKYPKHISVIDTSSKFSEIEGNIIRLTFTKDHGIDGNKEIINKYRGLNPHSLTIKYANISDGMSEEQIDDEMAVQTRLEIIDDYHSKSVVPDNINMVLLKKITKSIYDEVNDGK